MPILPILPDSFAAAMSARHCAVWTSRSPSQRTSNERPSPTSNLRHIGPNAVWETFHRACGLAGIKGVHPHDLRHGWVFTALSEGVSMQDVSLGVGHHSVETTKKIYARNLVIYPGMFRAAQMVQDARDAAAHEAAIGGGE